MNILSIIGATASGKSDFALELARRYNGEIISCDSVAIYKYFDIGTAKPTKEEQEEIPHHMLSVALHTEKWSAGRYAENAEICIDDITKRGKLPIVCGGTGLYFAALFGGLDDIPTVPKLHTGKDNFAKLREVDPQYAANLNPLQDSKINRALDVIVTTGKSITTFWTGGTKKKYSPVYVEISAENSEERICKRTDKMLELGLIEETQELLNRGISPNCTPMNSIGYKQVRQYLAGECEELRNEIILRTRQYAKRQRTWFRNKCPERIINPSEKNIIKIIETMVNL